jgi:hypothetical protein
VATVVVLAGRRGAFVAALSSAAAWVLAVAVLLQARRVAGSHRGVASDRRGGWGHVRPPGAVPRVGDAGLGTGRELSKGLAVLRRLGAGSRVIGFVLVAVFGQIFRNWLLLHAVGVAASFFDAIAVLIAVVVLGQLPVGPGAGAAAAVLILGRDGVAAAAAAGVLMTVTGTVGGLCFASRSPGGTAGRRPCVWAN